MALSALLQQPGYIQSFDNMNMDFEVDVTPTCACMYDMNVT